MKLETIRRSVERLFSAAGEIVFSVQLIRKSYGVYVPGTSPAVAETRYSVRLIKMKSPSGRSGLEEGPVLDKAIHLGLLESSDVAPQADDELDLPDGRVVISQSTSLDLGAGILFEVWYS